MSDSKKIDDGGHAYPVCFEGGQNNGDSPYFHTGLSARDWFAGQALPAACTLAFGNIRQATDMQLLPEEWAVSIALGVADAMIAARKAGG